MRGMRMTEMGGDGTNNHDELGRERISCASQFNIPDTAGLSLNPACHHSVSRASQPNQSGRAPDFLISTQILHIVLIFIPHLSLSHPQLYHHRRTQS